VTEQALKYSSIYTQYDELSSIRRQLHHREDVIRDIRPSLGVDVERGLNILTYLDICRQYRRSFEAHSVWLQRTMSVLRNMHTDDAPNDLLRTSIVHEIERLKGDLSYLEDTLIRADPKAKKTADVTEFFCGM
jgi:hypothetical protein